MAESKHFVQKYVFDVNYDSEENAYKFQTQLADFIKETIVALTDEVLSKATEGFLLSADKLTLDLGEISFDNYENEIYAKIKSQLSDKIALLLSGHFTGNTQESVTFLSKELSDLQIFDFFLQNGFLPWNIHQEYTSYSVKKLLIELIENNPPTIKKYIEKVTSDEVLRTRLIRQFDDEVLWKIITLWIGEPVFLKQFYKEIVTLYKRKPIIRNTFSEFRDLVWPFILNEVIIERKTNFETIQFTENLMNFVSEETKTEYYNVVLAFYNSIDDAINNSLKHVAPEITESVKAILLRDNFSDTTLKKKISESKELEKLFGEKGIKENKTSEESKKQNNRDPESGTTNDSFDRRNKELQQKEEELILTKFLSLRNEIFAVEKSSLSEIITRVERIIKTFSFSNPDFLKKSFAVAGWTLEEPATIKYLDLFSEEIRKQIILNILKKTESEFEQSVIEQEKNLIQRFFEIGHIPVLYSKPFTKDFKVFQTILLKTAEYNPEWFAAIFKRAVVESSDKDIKIPLLMEIFTVEVVKSIFKLARQEAELRPFLNRLETQSGKGKYPKSNEEEKLLNSTTEESNRKDTTPDNIEQDRKNLDEDDDSYFATRLSEINSPESAVYHLNIILKKSSPKSTRKGKTAGGDGVKGKKKKNGNITNSEVKLETLIPLFFEKYSSVAVSYFKSLSVKEQKSVLKTLKGEKLERVESLIKGHDRALEELIKEVRGENKVIVNTDHKAITKVEGGDGMVQKELKLEYKKMESGEPVYISNAGLVLVHPYLTRFFKMLNLTEGRAFKDEYSSHKAAHILQYLVNKNTSAEEHELVLNKLICGIALTTPLLRDIEITPEEIETCEGLLEGVIQNWTILKKTTNDNFRSSFLIRQGRLVLESKGWKLKVEEKAYDILVEKLPWSIAMIKMPWMNNIIYVEWK
ncbi:contractile injection system tape measure protein [Sporocytophaga myxococcoides]|uniref:contractile injection system tape measure protein n=1 Tax=Sporocytophaga myxococcoides TaxID=153721 RepID=UPI00040E856D|nr:contractile injection system tape measure protein [Sporocytophaga myxococcoides]